MTEFRSFDELPTVSSQESVPTETSEEVVEKMAVHERMLRDMGVNPEDNPKLDPEDFFSLAMLRCGYMGTGREFLHNSRKVILASTFQKAFIAYYGLTGPKKNVKYAEWFDEAYRRKKIDFISHSKGKDSFLCLPVREE